MLQQVAADAFGPFGLLALHGQAQVQRLLHAVLVGQIDDFVIRAYVQAAVHRCRDDHHALCGHHVAVRVERQPLRTVLDGVRARGRTLVFHAEIELLARSVGHLLQQAVGQPLQTAAVHIVAGRLRRSHRVAVLVLHVAQRHVDVPVVDALCQFVDAHQHLVVLAGETELQVRQFLVGHHGGCRLAGDAAQDFVGRTDEHIVAHRCRGGLLRHGVQFIAHLAHVVQVYLLTPRVGHRLDAVVLLPLLAVEGEIGQQTGLVALRTLRGVCLDER